MLADHLLANEMSDETRMLQRGILVNADATHSWGVRAFPNLPALTATETETPTQTLTRHDTIDNAGDFSEMTELEVERQVKDEGTAVIAQNINSLTFPGLKNAMLLQILLFVLLCCVEIPVLITVSMTFKEQMLEPLDFFEQLALLRTEGYAFTAVAQQLVFSALKQVSPPRPTSEEGPLSIGGNWSLVAMLKFWGARMADTLQEAANFRSFTSHDASVTRAKTLIFGDKVLFRYFEAKPPTQSRIRVDNALVNFLSLENTLLTLPQMVDISIINSSAFMNPLDNMPHIGLLITESIENLVTFVHEYAANLKDMFRLIVYCSIGGAVLLFAITLVLEVGWIRGNGQRVYSCLTALPKNHVSQIAENLRIRRREQEETSTQGNAESNKQEDNIMKIFVAGGSSFLSGIADQLAMIIAVVAVLILFVVILMMMAILVDEQTDVLSASSPHTTYLHGAWALAMATLTDMFQMFWLDTPYRNAWVDKMTLGQRFSQDQTNFTMFYTYSAFGNQTKGIKPLRGYRAGSREAREAVVCVGELVIPNWFDEATHCYSPDMIYAMIETLLESRVSRFMSSDDDRLQWTDIVQETCSLLIYPIFDVLVDPLFNTLRDTIREDLTTLSDRYYPLLFGFLALALFCQVISIVALMGVGNHLRHVLGLLLHCPGSVILQTSRVMTFLSGDFSNRRRDESAKTTTFFRSVVMQLPDAIVTVLVETMEIQSANAACDRIFGEGVASGSATRFITTKFQGDTSRLLAVGLGTKRKPQDLIYQRDETTQVNLLVTALPMGETIVLVFRDVTATVRHNTLIAVERSKSDQLLRSILPPSLVGRVQAGEKNISFAVSSATIIFMDIVSFTPWCGASTADKVMMTLNNLFRRFDSNCSNYSTVTRIKCIGDCYMAAGGVFSEINQPAEHAKQVVSFGLDSLDSVEALNEELGERLQMRVGVNTGGPIVAGVIGGGLGKPTFEIIGPAINLVAADGTPRTADGRPRVTDGVRAHIRRPVRREGERNRRGQGRNGSHVHCQ
jgi:class 3 adenylate cyclase